MSSAVPYSNEYRQLFSTIQVRPEHQKEIDAAVALISRGAARYQGLESITGVPWFFTGLVHYMEASCNFSKHLHNGDPLTSRTRNVPAGRPVFNPGHSNIPPSMTNPYSFEESVIDAYQFMQQNNKVWKSIAANDWSLEAMMYRLEAYNGFGYRHLAVPINSPYLWSFSNHYIKGKYVKDGPHGYDPNAVSKQAGTAVIMYSVMKKNNLLQKYLTVAAGGAGVLLLVATLFF